MVRNPEQIQNLLKSTKTTQNTKQLKTTFKNHLNPLKLCERMKSVPAPPFRCCRPLRSHARLRPFCCSWHLSQMYKCGQALLNLWLLPCWHPPRLCFNRHGRCTGVNALEKERIWSHSWQSWITSMCKRNDFMSTLRRQASVAKRRKHAKQHLLQKLARLEAWLGDSHLAKLAPQYMKYRS